MKKFAYFLTISIFALTLTACANNVEIEDPMASGGDIISLAESCTDNDGVWLEDFSECELISEDWCLNNGGSFSECESACRHDDEDVPCIDLCVPVCSF